MDVAEQRSSLKKLPVSSSPPVLFSRPKQGHFTTEGVSVNGGYPSLELLAVPRMELLRR